MNNHIVKHVTIITVVLSGYTVGEDGEVISWKYNQPRVLKQSIGNHGYAVVNLRLDGRSVHMSVHRLVALFHLEAVEGCPLVNHKDGNKLNNHKENLEWTTHSGNIQHYYDSLK